MNGLDSIAQRFAPGSFFLSEPPQPATRDSVSAGAKVLQQGRELLQCG
jgi:hypothetical protein